MSKPKTAFSEDLAARARAGLDAIDHRGIALKLHAIIAAAKHPVGTVAEVLGVATETVWRWATAYRKNGLEALYPKPRAPKPSKLTPEQKAETLSWLDTGKTSSGENVHWTLERLRYAIGEKFGVTLGINTIWVWLRKEGRKLKVPRPRHYEADGQAQADFKKN
jgi:transposase